MENQFKKSFPEDADLCFEGINFTGALLALAAAHSNMKVVIALEESPDFTFQPELVTLYPLDLGNYFNYLSSISLVEKIASYYPSLVYPQRILTIMDNKKFLAKKLSLTDSLLKRERDEASLPFRFSNYEQYKVLENHFLNAALIHEFRFDRNIALVYLLLECKRQGITIIKKRTGVTTRTTVICSRRWGKSIEISIDANFPFSNNLRIINPYFETLVQKAQGTFNIRFVFLKQISEKLFLEKAITYLKYLGINIPENIHNQLKEDYHSSLKNSFQEGENNLTIEDFPLTSIKKNCKEISSKLSEKAGRKIRLESWLRTIKPVRLNGEHFRQVQSVCDEKFDLAKQTGIEYDRFCYYFFRYSDMIDEFTEQAYQQLEYDRTGQIEIWDKIEKHFQQQIEEMILSQK
jgi:hypothetical protein